MHCTGMVCIPFVWYALVMVIDAMVCIGIGNGNGSGMVCIDMSMHNIPYHTIANALVWYAFPCMVCIDNGTIWYGMVCIGIGNGNGNCMVCIGNGMLWYGMHWK
jgi:hypothetical protein